MENKKQIERKEEGMVEGIKVFEKLNVSPCFDSYKEGFVTLLDHLNNGDINPSEMNNAIICMEEHLAAKPAHPE